MYGVNSHDHIYRANLMNRTGCKRPGALVQISAHGTKVVGVNRGGFVYQYLGNGRWKHFGNAPRPARWASMGKDGDFWVIGRNQRIYRLAGRRFQRIPGALVQIDVADRRNVVGVNSAQQIWQWGLCFCVVRAISLSFDTGLYVWCQCEPAISAGRWLTLSRFCATVVCGLLDFFLCVVFVGWFCFVLFLIGVLIKTCKCCKKENKKAESRRLTSRQPSARF